MAVSMKRVELLEIQLSDIKSATDDFNDSHCIGRGGFGKVYKGSLPHFKERSLVAFKRLNSICGQGGAEYSKEIKSLSLYTHDNLISLLGFCRQGTEMILLFEHASRGSLDRHLHSADLTWKQRVKICLGAAKGLNYLHDPRETGQRLIHCDIKSANILLDDEWNAKVADFGLSKIAPANPQNSSVATNPLGTHGYCDPLFWEYYKLTKESDVYSFGVVLFEVLCGRLCYEIIDGHLNVLVYKWKRICKEKNLDEIMFQHLKKNTDPTSLETFSGIAFQCLEGDREARPSMSEVVEKLETALKNQELHDYKLFKEYAEIVNAATTPLTYKSVEDLIVLLSNGVFVKDGGTWFSLSHSGGHRELISIAECLSSHEDEEYSSRYSSGYNSRFPVGCYNTGGSNFETSIRTQFLSPGIAYTVNLIFKCPYIFKEKVVGKQQYIDLIYSLEGERKISSVHLGNKREDEWLIARLHEFTSHQSVVDLEIQFESHEHINSLELEGIEFQPLEISVEDDDRLALGQYQEIVKSAEPRLIYRSIQELKLLLSKGVLLNSGNTWFYLNDDEQHCEMISIKECLIPVAGEKYHYIKTYNSRFLVDIYFRQNCTFRTRVRAQYLSPSITYTVNLVFKIHHVKEPKNVNIRLSYRLERETTTFTSHLADEIEDDWWMIELCQFTSQGTTAYFEIIFEGSDPNIVVEGIEFQPLKIAEHHVLDEEQVATQPISSVPDTYWEQKLPNGYEDIIKLSKDRVIWTTKKELHLMLSKGFLMYNGQEWFYLHGNGKKCLMLSARAAVDPPLLKWLSAPESRFGETMELGKWEFRIKGKITSQVLESETRYATYLVYKLPQDQSRFEAPVVVWDTDLGLKSWEVDDKWYIYLVRPRTPVIVGGTVDQNPQQRRSDGWMNKWYICLCRPQKPVIVRGTVDQNARMPVIDRGTVDQNADNPLNRPKLKGIPQQRSDGWMEVQVWEIQTANTNEMIHLHLKLRFVGPSSLEGLIIQGIEFRPV